jgi:tetratricopeptide (TPR) repeat protein
VKLQQMQPTNHELYVAAGQAAQAFGNAQGALDQFNKALSVVKVLLRARRAPSQRACMYPCALCARVRLSAWNCPHFPLDFSCSRNRRVVNTVTRVRVQDKKTQAEVYEKIGDLLKSLKDFGQAKSAYDSALAADPKRVSVLVARGLMSQEHDAYQLAEEDFLNATALDPRNAQAWSGLGVAWMYLEHACSEGECKPPGYDSYDEGSIAALRKVMQLMPDNMVTLSNLVIAENRCCDWSNRDKNLGLLRGALRDAAAKKQNFAPPFHAFEFAYSPKEMLVNCKYLSLHHQNSAKAGKAAVPISAARERSHVEKNGFRLNVGYTNGAGFHNGTTTARSLRSMFSFHDPTRINVMCYALSGDDKSEERQTIKAACSGGWTEGRAMSDEELATKVANDNVHVLVDSTGYTMKYRAEFLAMSTAPIILSYHGFPGTMAAKFIHYLSSDVRTAPPEYQSFYSEKLALVPWTYLVNDHKQSRREVLTGNAPSRASLGFSDDDIILASFNQHKFSKVSAKGYLLG